MKQTKSPHLREISDLSEKEKYSLMRLFNTFFPGLGHYIVGRHGIGLAGMLIYIAALGGVMYFALQPYTEAFNSAMNGLPPPNRITVKYGPILAAVLVAVLDWIFMRIEPSFKIKKGE